MRIHTLRSARLAALAAAVGVAAFGSLAAQDTTIVGDWEGAISTQGIELPIVIHVSADDEGALTATMDSPSQGALGIATTDVAFVDGTFTFSVPDVPGGGAYEARLGDDGTLDGTWTQGPNSVELDLSRVKSDGG